MMLLVLTCNVEDHAPRSNKNVVKLTVLAYDTARP